MYKLIILITTTDYKEYDGIRLRADYFRCVAAAGGIPLLVPPLPAENAAELAATADGLLLSGGGDMEPQWYGQIPMCRLSGVDAARDALEVALVNAFWQRRLPILGICRGCQVLNVALGGTLYQDIALFSGVAGKSKASIRHDQPEDRHSVTHKVALISTDLQQMFGETLLVNSHHHQAIEQTARPLRVAARSEDLLIEAVSARESSRFCLGVQWHPECLPAHLPLFNALVEAAATQV